jgi:hypothetical protein
MLRGAGGEGAEDADAGPSPRARSVSSLPRGVTPPPLPPALKRPATAAVAGTGPRLGRSLTESRAAVAVAAAAAAAAARAAPEAAAAGTGAGLAVRPRPSPARLTSPFASVAAPLSPPGSNQAAPQAVEEGDAAAAGGGGGGGDGGGCAARAACPSCGRCTCPACRARALAAAQVRHRDQQSLRSSVSRLHLAFIAWQEQRDGKTGDGQLVGSML